MKEDLFVVLGGGGGVGNELAATPSKIHGGKRRVAWYHLQLISFPDNFQANA